jgi:hypothetical protein
VTTRRRRCRPQPPRPSFDVRRLRPRRAPAGSPLRPASPGRGRKRPLLARPPELPKPGAPRAHSRARLDARPRRRAPSPPAPSAAVPIPSERPSKRPPSWPRSDSRSAPGRFATHSPGFRVPSAGQESSPPRGASRGSATLDQRLAAVLRRLGPDDAGTDDTGITLEQYFVYSRPFSRAIVRPRAVGGGTTCEPRFAGANRSR